MKLELPVPESKPTIKKGSKSEYNIASDPEQLTIAQLVIDSFARDPKVRETFLPFGYTDEKISRFSSAQVAAAQAYSKQKAEHGDKTGSQGKFEKSFSAAKLELSCIIKLLKIIVKNDKERSKTLLLSGKKSSVPNAVLDYMRHFYDTLLADNELIELLSVYGYGEKKIHECRKSYLIALDLYGEYQKDYKEAKDATKEKEEKMEILNQWMYEYYTVAKVAFLMKS